MRGDEAKRQAVQTVGMVSENIVDAHRLARAPEHGADKSARQMHRRNDRFAEQRTVLRLLAIDGVEQAGGPPRLQAPVAVEKGFGGQARGGEEGDVQRQLAIAPVSMRRIIPFEAGFGIGLSLIHI